MKGLVALLLTLQFATLTGQTIRTAEDAIRRLEANGWKAELNPATSAGSLRKNDGSDLSLELKITSIPEVREVVVDLELRLKVPQTLSEDRAVSLLAELSPDCRIAHLLLDNSIHLRAEPVFTGDGVELLAHIDGFWSKCRRLQLATNARAVSSNCGLLAKQLEVPPGRALSRASFWALGYLLNSWWPNRQPPVNATPEDVASGQLRPPYIVSFTVARIELALLLAKTLETITDTVWLTGAVPVEKGIDPQSVIEGLKMSTPELTMRRSRVWCVPYRDHYVVCLELSLNGLTAGDLKKAIEEFADLVNKHPRRTNGLVLEVKELAGLKSL